MEESRRRPPHIGSLAENDAAKPGACPQSLLLSRAKRSQTLLLSALPERDVEALTEASEAQGGSGTIRHKVNEGGLVCQSVSNLQPGVHSSLSESHHLYGVCGVQIKVAEHQEHSSRPRHLETQQVGVVVPGWSKSKRCWEGSRVGS